MCKNTRDHSAAHPVLLWSLTVLFTVRVAAQAVQYASPIRVLQPFEAWQGSGLGYSVLLASQLAILAVMVRGASRISRRVRTVRRLGVWLVTLGGVYFGAMSVRLVLGLTMLADVSWFSKPLPAFAHLVLASYLITLGHYHLRRA